MNTELKPGDFIQINDGNSIPEHFKGKYGKIIELHEGGRPGCVLEMKHFLAELMVPIIDIDYTIKEIELSYDEVHEADENEALASEVVDG
jgi:hypothetical protein